MSFHNFQIAANRCPKEDTMRFRWNILLIVVMITVLSAIGGTSGFGNSSLSASFPIVPSIFEKTSSVGIAHDASANLSYLYPSANESAFSGSLSLSSQVLAQLGLSNFTLLSPTGVADPNDFQNQTYLPDGSYIDGPVVRFVDGSSWASFRYSAGGQFLGFSIVDAGVFYSGPRWSDKLNSTRAAIQSLGIPVQADSTWTLDDEAVYGVVSGAGWRNQTVVRVHTLVAAMDLIPANSLTIRFENYSPYAVLRMDVSAWFSADWTSMMPTSSLQAAAEQFVRTYNQSRNWTIQSTRQVALVPFPDSGTFGALYGITISSGSDLADAEVSLDAWSGQVLKVAITLLTPGIDRGSPAPLAGSAAWFVYLAIVVGAGMIAWGTLFRGVESVRYGTILLLAQLAPAVRGTHIDNFVQGQVLGCVTASPGITYTGISKTLGLANGVLTYHISVLQKEGFIRSRLVGSHKCFYPAGSEQPSLEPAILSPVQRKIVELVRREPGISPGAIATSLGIHRRNSSYNIRRLAAMGFLSVTRNGRRKSCRLIAGPEPSDFL